MLVDLNGVIQPTVGNQPHWSMFAAVMADPVVYDPLHVEITQIVADAIAANPNRPQISSRQAGAEVLQAIGSRWHAEFPRRFPNFPNGAERGVFGMALWHYLAVHPDKWCFSGIADPYGHGQDATEYWRL